MRLMGRMGPMACGDRKFLFPALQSYSVKV
jgi:hypothetical protein